MNEIQTLIGQWTKRLLTPIGRITVIKSILKAKLTHLLINLPNPNEQIIHQLESDLFDFLWNKKPDKISRKQIIQPYNNGGLNIIHLNSFISSMTITWMKKLLSSNSIWVSIFDENAKTKKELLFTLGAEFPKNIAKNTRNVFWKDTLNAFSHFKEINMDLMQEKSYIHHEIWYNKEIKIDKTCIFYSQWYERCVRYIHDLTDEYGTILTYENFCQKFNFNPSILDFYGIINSIFQRWPSLRNLNFKIDLSIIPSYIRIILQNKKKKPVYETFMHPLKFKEKYKHKWSTRRYIALVADTALNNNITNCKWSTHLDSCMSKKKWKFINSLPFKITQDTTLRWVQYRIIHRCIATNELLHKINILDSNFRTFCGEHVESILHLFGNCKHVNFFGMNLNNGFYKIFEYT